MYEDLMESGVVLADEPSAGLACERARQFMHLFVQAAHEHEAGVTVVTHDHRALHVFGTNYEMEDGRMRQSALVLG